MKKKALALSVLAAISSQAGAFQFDTGDDWSIRWDNQLKGNLGFRTTATKRSVVDPSVYPNARINDDASFSVNRKNGGVTTSRIDLRSELDVVWRQDFGFRVSGAGWYDPTYDNSDNPKSGTLPRTGGLAYDYSWAGLTYAPGEYSHEAQWQHKAGGELLDAFVFGNWNIGETALGVRAGRHTIFWGQSLLANGAVTGIAGSMTALDLSKGLSVPGTEAQELFMPSTKISTVFQATDNLTLNAYYEFEHRVNRNPETGSYMSPQEVLTENSECFVLVGGVNGGPRTCFKVRDDKVKDSGNTVSICSTPLRPGTWKLHGCISTVPIASSRASTARSVGLIPTSLPSTRSPGKMAAPTPSSPVSGVGPTRMMSRPSAWPWARRCSISASAWISRTARTPA